MYQRIRDRFFYPKKIPFIPSHKPQKFWDLKSTKWVLAVKWALQANPSNLSTPKSQSVWKIIIDQFCIICVCLGKDYLTILFACSHGSISQIGAMNTKFALFLIEKTPSFPNQLIKQVTTLGNFGYRIP